MALMYNKTDMGTNLVAKHGTRHGTATVPDRLKTADYVRDGDIVSSKKESPLSKAYKNINPAKDILDRALMDKYPDVDFDMIKKGAEGITNPELENYLTGDTRKKYLNYYLTPEEMKGVLEGTGYENFIQNANAIRNVSDITNTEGMLEKDMDPLDQKYGMRHMLYKYATPKVQGKLMPYRFSSDLN